MKHYIARVFKLLGLVLILSLSSFSGGIQVFSTIPAQKVAQEASVYVCTGKYARRYHSTSNCGGLNNCKGSIETRSLVKVQKAGYTPCKICYK